MDKREAALWAQMGKAVHVEIDRPIGYRHGDIRYPVNYGYIPGTTAGDGEAQDVYILGVTEPLKTFDGQIIGAVRRKNDCEDKLVAAPAGMQLHQGQITEAVQFQEQYFESYILCLFRKSCGVLPYRITEAGREYLIVFEQHSQCWSLPKGHMEPGETEQQTALRELFEETGLTAVLDEGERAVIEYPIAPAARKQVVFFPGQVSGTPRVREGEIGSFRWVTAQQLKDFLFPDTADALAHLLK